MVKQPRKFKTHDNRWGPGRVHIYLYDSLNKVWYVGCREPYDDPHGERCDDDEPVTCTRCLAGG